MTPRKTTRSNTAPQTTVGAAQVKSVTATAPQAPAQSVAKPVAKPVAKKAAKTTAQTAAPAAVTTAAKAAPKTAAKTAAKNAPKTGPKAVPTVPTTLRLYQIQADASAPADSHLHPWPQPEGGLLPWLEALLQIHQQPDAQNSDHWGLMPDNLTLRTGYTGAQLQSAIRARPGFDVYFCHAQPELEAVFHNPWMQAEANHPGFIAIAREFLQAAGLPDIVTDTVTHSAAFATGHMIVARPAFWANYISFLDQTLKTALPRLSEATRNSLNTPHKAGQLTPLHLIAARLPGLFFMRKDQPWHICKLPTPQDRELNPHLRLLREMKDTAVELKSGWLTACWANYRTLYLAQTAGASWMGVHMSAITPQQLLLGTHPTHVQYRYSTTTQARMQ